MKSIVFLLFAAIAVSNIFEETAAQRPVFQTLPYYPPRRPPPRPIRVRRQVLVGSAGTSAKNGGADAKLELATAVGTPTHNVVGTAFAAGNTNRGPVTTGGALDYNINGHGLGLTASRTPGGTDSFGQNAHVNLFNNDKHNLDAKAFASQNTLANGFKFDRNGVGLDYNHANGHGASLTHSNIPNFGRQLELAGRANLWTSQDRNTKLDLTGRGSQWLSGPFSGQRDLGAGVGLTHFFGKN